MRKEDFLEILKDYLKNSFSQEEIMDIVRDYEEYFIDGEIEGKTEMDIIASLGSPKEIAKELVSQSSDKNINKNKNKLKNKFDDVIYVMEDIKNDDAKIKAAQLKTRITCDSWILLYLNEGVSNKKDFEKTTDKYKELLSKFRVNLKDKNHVKNRDIAKKMQKLLRIVEIPFKLIINICLICFALTLIASIAGPILLAPFVTSFMSVMPELKMVVVFGIIAYIGVEILLWQLFFVVFKLVKKLKKAYLNWLETNNLYINGSIKKEAMEQDGGLLDEQE